MKKLLEKLHLDTYTVSLSIAIGLFCLIISVTSILRFEHFLSGKLDLGNMMQTVWNTQHGKIFQFTDPYSTETMSRLGTHADVFLILLVPLYIVFPSAWTLLILQAVVLGLGAVVIYLLGVKLTRSKFYSLLFGLLFLLNPSVIRSSLYDFHAVVLATTFLLVAWYSILERKFGWFVFWSILAGITKEQVWIITAFLSLYYAYKTKEYIKAGLFAGFSLVLCFLLVQYIIPHANNAPHFALEYYSNYGSGVGGVIKGVLIHPFDVIKSLTDTERLSFLWQIFSPLSIFSLLAPLFLIFMAPELLGYLLSNNHNMHVLYYQYTATLTPFIFIAGLYGFRFVWTKVKGYSFKHIVLLPLFLIGFFFSYRYGPYPLSREPQLNMFTPFTVDMNEFHTYLKNIPETASVSASNNIGAHLSNREHIYIYPIGYDISDYIVVDKSKEDLESLTFGKILQSTYLVKDFENSRYVVYRRANE